MKFGLFGGAVANKSADTADSKGYDGFVDLIIEAEKLGYESIFMVEHHFTGGGQVSASLNLLTYIAAKTEKIRLGTSVTVLPWHNPVLLAEQTATLDLLSGGRLDFGVGKGYRDMEYKGFCIPREEALERFQESIEVIKKAWTSEERFSHDGKFWQFDDIIVEPYTIQEPHPPLWTAAGTDESIARVAESDMNVLFDQFASFERTEERLKVWQKACAASGRGFDPMEVGLARGLTITLSEEEYQDALKKRDVRVTKMIEKFGALPGLVKDEPESYSDPILDMEEAALIGNPDKIIERLKILESMGFTHILILIPDNIETLQIFASEVMPEFREEKTEIISAA